MSKAPLEAFQMPLACGSRGWGFRWSFARAPVLLDRTGGRLPAALLRQATITDGEAESILIEHDRIYSWQLRLPITDERP